MSSSKVFFFKQKTAYEMRISDWSSDVCSSDLRPDLRPSALSGIAGRGRSPHRRPFAHSAPKAVSFHRRGSAERQVARARQGSRAVASRLRPRSEEQTSVLHSLMRTSYAVFTLKTIKYSY